MYKNTENISRLHFVEIQNEQKCNNKCVIQVKNNELQNYFSRFYCSIMHIACGLTYETFKTKNF